MALNIKNAQRDRLSLRVVRRETARNFQRFLEEEFWPQLPASELGKRLAKRERERILGYGSAGV